MIEFILNNKIIRTAQNPGMTLLDFVRYEKKLHGTKIGCREGDCGACTVLIGSISNSGNLEYKSITSCISPLGNVQGKHVVTVEGTNLKEKLTVVQEAMKSNYATQCGFCTPGFVVALTGFSLSNAEKNSTNAIDAISGNICRCTGYKSIKNAAENVCQKLDYSKKTMPLDWLIENDFIPEYFKDINKKLAALNTKPASQNSGKVVSGGTDLYVQQADNLIDNTVGLISNNESLKGIQIEQNVCTIGANATVSNLWNHTVLNTYFPNLKKHLKLVSSEQIRNMASFGGNIVNASPIGDMTIFFLALNSDITFSNESNAERTIALKDFYNGYKTFDLKEGELIKSIHFKLPEEKAFFNFEKVCKRTHLDIASVNTAIQIEVKDNFIANAHVSIGGVFAFPKYLEKTSAFLTGRELNAQLIIEANTMLQTEISPISDVRGTSEYKRLLSRQLFYSHFIELFPATFSLNNFVQYA